VNLVEMPRTRENAFCCVAGRGVQEAFPDFARWAAAHRMDEVREVGAEALVSACPWCKNNFTLSAQAIGDVQVLDISEVICASMEG
jgi:Fe-S oxidoreductase